ncbi:MAG: tRNA (adenosine(37)-N6)-threonylcarbamoyltransferase complex dimerization subunit type 1 TsaB [Limnobacter sp.]|uniref:tRNA (adenosine(37)-N6)-threonylcarbamoyltransferase complex dimerization subunit type 1 TsaB n=1 Tax=Limnobacter sp. TaxID=2003368 RepID=UPI0032EC68FB
MVAARFILAISTSSGVAKVAAAAEPLDSGAAAQTLFNYEIVDYKSQSAQLLPKLEQHLQAAGLQATQCAAIAADIGPGGFTSLRTACGIAQGLAVAWQVPVVTLTSFECMLPQLEQAEPLAILIDARLNEIYAAKIQRSAQGTQWVEPPYLLAMNALPSVQGPAVCDAHLFAMLAAPAPGIQQGEVAAVQLACLAWQEFNAGRVVTPFDCQPLYVRDKVAQTTSERLALKHGAV